MIDFKLSKLKLSDLTLSELKASDFKNIDRGSLKLGIIKAILLGTLLAVVVYGIINGVSDFVLENFYATDGMRRVREERLIDEFREYVAENEISSDDKEAISRFADQRTYIYLLIYKGDEFYFSSGMYDDAALISLCRVTLMSLLFGNFQYFIFSLFGATFAYLAMLALCRINSIGRVGVSVASAAAHSVGQIVAAALIYSSPALVSYLPILLVASVLSGTLNGILLILIERRLDVIYKRKDAEFEK